MTTTEISQTDTITNEESDDGCPSTTVKSFSIVEEDQIDFAFGNGIVVAISPVRFADEPIATSTPKKFTKLTKPMRLNYATGDEIIAESSSGIQLRKTAVFHVENSSPLRSYKEEITPVVEASSSAIKPPQSGTNRSSYAIKRTYDQRNDLQPMNGTTTKRAKPAERKLKVPKQEVSQSKPSTSQAGANATTIPINVIQYSQSNVLPVKIIGNGRNEIREFSFVLPARASTSTAGVNAVARPENANLRRNNDENIERRTAMKQRNFANIRQMIIPAQQQQVQQSVPVKRPLSQQNYLDSSFKRVDNRTLLDYIKTLERNGVTVKKVCPKKTTLRNNAMC